MYPPDLEIKDTTESNTSAPYLDLFLSIRRDGQLHTSLYDKRDDFSFHITKISVPEQQHPIFIGSSMVGRVILSNNMRYPSPKCYTIFWMVTINSDTLHYTNLDPITDLDLITECDFLPKCEMFP